MACSVEAVMVTLRGMLRFRARRPAPRPHRRGGAGVRDRQALLDRRHERPVTIGSATYFNPQIRPCCQNVGYGGNNSGLQAIGCTDWDAPGELTREILI
jgi:hypothetical protein